jgi:hypothetical protein
MMDELKKMMAGKKSDGKMSEDEKQAKMDVIKELLDMAQHAMGHGVKGGMDEMHKVSVMAPDEEGLEEGLGMAKKVVGHEEEDPELEAKEEKLHMDLDGDNEEGEPAEHVAKVLGEEAPEGHDVVSDDEEADDMPNIFAQRREKMKAGRKV